MNLWGKSLAMAVLLLAGVFVVMALLVNASHRNWRDVVLAEDGMLAQKESILETQNELRGARALVQAAWDREQAAGRTAIAEAQTQIDQLQSQLRESSATVQDLQAKNDELTVLDRSRAEELDEVTTEAKRLREQVRAEQQERDRLFAETLKLTNQKNLLNGIRQNQDDENTQLVSQISRYKEVVDAAGLNINDPLDGAPPPREGEILVVSGNRNLVAVSIGYDDGLRDGHLLEVTRDGRYVTKLRVRRTEPNRSVAEVLRNYSEGSVMEGDRVDTTYE